MAVVELSSTSLFSDPALSHYWKLENLNATVGGIALNNPTGKSFVAAKFGNGIDMGSTIRNALELNTTTNVIPTATSPFTISLWFKQNIAISAANIDPGLLTCSTGAASGYAIAIIPIWNGGSPQIQVKRRTASDANDVVAFGNDTTIWHNLIHTYNGSTMTNYLDGVAFGSAISSSGNFNASAYPELSIGGSFFSNSAMSIIDDVSLFSKSLSLAEVGIIVNGDAGVNSGFFQFM